jgi:peptide/nickel transport system substrate-binding protein
MDPVRQRSLADFNGIYNVFEYLYFTDIAGNLGPALATGYTVSSDGLAYTFNLRNGVTWHNGDPFTANDVKFSFDRALNPAEKWIGAYQLASLAGVDVIDPSTVRFRFKALDHDFVTAFCYMAIVPQNYLTQKGDAYFGQHPVGTGPFKVDSFTLNQSLALSRFENYWGAKAGFQTAQQTYIADTPTRLDALKSGQVDLIDGLQPQSVAGLGNFKAGSAGSGEVYTFDFNFLEKNAPYQNEQVRYAIDYAIDKPAIIKDLLLGYGLPSVAGLFPGQPGYAQANLSPRAYNPAMAKQLLSAAGFGSGFTLNVVGIVNGRFGPSGDVAQAVGGYLNDVGIKTDVKILPDDQWLDALEATTNLGPAIIFDGSGVNDYYTFITGVIAPDFLYSHGTDPHITTLAQAMNASTSQSQYVSTTVAAATYFHQQATFIDLYSDKGIWAWSPSVSYQPWNFLGNLTPLVNAQAA